MSTFVSRSTPEQEIMGTVNTMIFAAICDMCLGDGTLFLEEVQEFACSLSKTKKFIQECEGIAPVKPSCFVSFPAMLCFFGTQSC